MKRRGGGSARGAPKPLAAAGGAIPARASAPASASTSAPASATTGLPSQSVVLAGSKHARDGQVAGEDGAAAGLVGQPSTPRTARTAPVSAALMATPPSISRNAHRGSGESGRPPKRQATITSMLTPRATPSGASSSTRVHPRSPLRPMRELADARPRGATTEDFEEDEQERFDAFDDEEDDDLANESDNDDQIAVLQSPLRRRSTGVAKVLSLQPKHLTPIATSKRVSAGATSIVETDRQALVAKLKAFDLDMKYGNNVGLTRLERWERAQRLGLDPPSELEAVLRSVEPDDVELREGLWHGRV
ncbi:hypothetical protein DFJ73DRAFT_843645 [Zopfochytrium polystomum]|nr:hypothetical protein DFJ73DRAFT_843645 [Zopfochytrium polystomum]